MKAAADILHPPSPSHIVARSKRIALDVLAPTADQVDQLRQFPRKNIAALGKGQVLGLMVPVEFGGAASALMKLATPRLSPTAPRPVDSGSERQRSADNSRCKLFLKSPI